MCKSVWLFLCFILLSHFSLAQQELVEVVYLNNGSRLKGVILEMIPNQSIKLKLFDESILVLKMEDIEKITKEPLSNKKSDLKSSDSDSIPAIEKKNEVSLITDSTALIRKKIEEIQLQGYKGRFYTTPYLGIHAFTYSGIGINNKPGFEIGGIVSYFFNPHWSISTGLTVTNMSKSTLRGNVLHITGQADSCYIETLNDNKDITILSLPVLFRRLSGNDRKVGFYLDLGMEFGAIFYSNTHVVDDITIFEENTIGFNYFFTTVGAGLKIPVIPQLSITVGPKINLGITELPGGFEFVRIIGGTIGVMVKI